MTLDAHHPLRLLLSPPPAPRIDQPTNFVSIPEEHHLSDETNPFAFRANLHLPNMADLPSDHDVGLVENFTLRPSLMPRRSPAADEILSYPVATTDVQPFDDLESGAEDTAFQPLPFSIPGPLYTPERSRSVSLSHDLPGPDLAHRWPPPPSPPSLPGDPLFLSDFPALDCSNSLTSEGQSGIDVLEPAFTLDQIHTSSNDINTSLPDFSTSNSVPFSTPGPAHSLTYFDSPAEEVLTDSDSLQLADEAPGFSWQPFNRKGPSSEASSLSPFRYHAA